MVWEEASGNSLVPVEFKHFLKFKFKKVKLIM